MAITPIWLTGLESGVFSTQGGGIFSAASGTPTIDSSIKRTGNYSLKITSAGAGAVNARRNMSANNQIAVARGYFLIPTGGLPGSTISIFGWQITTVAQTGGVTITSAGSLRATVGGGSAVTAMTINLDQWYMVDMILNITGSTWTLDWAVDGVAQTQAVWASQATNDSLQYIRFGSASSTAVYTTYFDDIILSETSADYPIGEGGTTIIVPISDGTHNAGTNVMENQAGTDLGTAWSLIDDIPMSTATEYIRQAANGTGNYAEVLFGDTTLGGKLLGASAILAYTSETTSSNTGGAIVSSNSFSSHDVLWGESGALQDYSDGSTASLFYKNVMLTGGDDRTNINNMKARMGYSSDASPDPYWINVAIEVAYRQIDTGSVSKTLGTLTSSASGTVSGGTNNATVNKTLGTLTSSAAAITITNASLVKTLGSLARTSSGTVSVSATVAKTLGALTATSSGTVSVSASLAKTLGALTSSSQATVQVIATLTKTLGNLLSAAITNVLITGTTSKTLGSLTSTSASEVDITASLIKTLGALISTSDADVEVKAALSKTLGSLTLSSQGGSASFANVDEVLGALIASSSGDVLIAATLQKTLGSLASSSNGDVDIVATLSKTLGQLLISSSGTVDTDVIEASLNRVLGNLTASITAEADIAGTLNKILGNLSALSSGKVTVRGATNKTLGSLVSSASGVIIAQGTVNIQLGELTLESNAFSGAEITAILIATLGGLTVDSQGAVGTETIEYEVIAFITMDVNHDTTLKTETTENLMITNDVNTSTFVS